MSTRGPGPQTDDENSYELGDLELAPRGLRPSVREAATQPPQTADTAGRPATDDDELALLSLREPIVPDNDAVRAIGLPTGASDFHGGFDDELEGDSLELDLPEEELARITSSKPPKTASSPTPSARGSQPSLPVRAEEARLVEQLAGYGPSPRGLGAARYAVHVASRAFTLWRERHALEEQAERLAEAYETTLVAFGKTLLEDPSVLAHEALRSHVTSAQNQERALAAVQQGAESARKDDAGTLEELERRRAEEEQRLAPYLAAERSALEAEQKLRAELKRTKAQLQRAEIEVRALDKASIPPPPERLQQTVSEREQRKALLEATLAAHAQANEALTSARRVLSQQRVGLDAVEREHAVLSRRARDRHRAIDEQISDAEHALARALCGLAEAADRVGLADAAQDQVAALREREAALDALVEKIARYDRALPLYDHEGLTRGVLLWLGLAFALMILIRLV